MSHEVDGDLHRDTWTQIPWVVNGTADEPTRVRVERHVRGCTECRSEYEFQQSLMNAMQERPELAKRVEPGLRKLMRRVDGQATEYGVPRMPWLLRALMAAVLFEAVGLGLLGLQVFRGDGVQVGSTDYHTLSQLGPVVKGPTVQLVFKGDTSAAQIGTVLRTYDLAVVDGPTPGGVFTLVPRTDAPGTTSLSQRVNELRGREDVAFVALGAGSP